MSALMMGLRSCKNRILISSALFSQPLHPRRFVPLCTRGDLSRPAGTTNATVGQTARERRVYRGAEQRDAYCCFSSSSASATIGVTHRAISAKNRSNSAPSTELSSSSDTTAGGIVCPDCSM